MKNAIMINTITIDPHIGDKTINHGQSTILHSLSTMNAIANKPVKLVP